MPISVYIQKPQFHMKFSSNHSNNINKKKYKKKKKKKKLKN